MKMDLGNVSKAMVVLDPKHVLTFSEYGKAWMIIINHETRELEWREYKNIKYVEDTTATRQ